MTDLLFVLLLVALFAVTAGMVAACDRLLGADDEITTVAVVEDDQAQRAAA